MLSSVKPKVTYQGGGVIQTIWYPWFAWYPVRVCGTWVWLRTIEKQECEDMGGTFNQYRLSEGK